jgi:flavin-dependent dehydrogenase
MRDSSQLQTDVCVIGGGPAGAAVARRLRQLGHSIIVIERQTFPRCHVGESLLGEVLPLLEVLGVRSEIENAGFLRPRSTIIRWTKDLELRPTVGERHFQVDRGRFDQLLLNSCQQAGAEILQPARVLGLKRNNEGGWRIIAHGNNTRVTIDSRFLVDASGRSGVLPRVRHRSSEKTLAMYAYWLGVPCEGSETRIEAGEDEWYWGAPLPNGEINASVFIDIDRYRAAVAQSGSRDTFYESLLARSKLLAVCLKGSRVGPVRVCDATQSFAGVPATADAISIGEAAFSIDPLSSQGVQTAIGSALHAAAVINTIIRHPEDSALAIEFYCQRQRDSVKLHSTAATRFYAEASQYRTGAYWQRRAQRDTPAEFSFSSPSVLPELKPRTNVRLASNVRFSTIPTVQGDFVKSTTALTAPGLSQPVAFVSGIPVGPLAAMIDNQLTVEQLIDSWSQRLPPDRAMAIARWLWNVGILCTAST